MKTSVCLKLCLYFCGLNRRGIRTLNHVNGLVHVYLWLEQRRCPQLHVPSDLGPLRITQEKGWDRIVA